jgi:tRNA U34 2-thiouridine synthase MnmA/TrmU
MKKAVVLNSGGLDSQLTLHILRNHGVEPIGLRFRSWFLLPKFKDFDAYPGEECVDGFTVINRDISEAYTELLLHPRFGRGSGANPCIDCKLLFLKEARKLMNDMGAYFVATGEVIGQRPMSQRPEIMRLLEQQSGLEGYLLRPLSAHLLPPTIPEELGWVEREELYGFSGRSRVPQMKLAAQFGMSEYPSPAGGCLLAEPNFGRRFADLATHAEHVETQDLFMLKYGRHFRISRYCKLVVGKNQEECEYLKRIDWGNVTIEAYRPTGPFSRMRWDGVEEHLHTAVDIVARYSLTDSAAGEVVMMVRRDDVEEEVLFKGKPNKEKSDSMLIR